MLATAAVNLIIGLLIGWSGIAGFLLPIYFVSYLNLPVTSALAVSFFVFAISSAIGSYNYYKKGNLDLRISIVIGVGSLVGALIGVYLNLLIPARTVKLILYVVVLLSGLSILLRMNAGEKAEGSAGGSGILNSAPAVAAIGVVTGAICSISGAGGPILVMPLLVSLGMNVRTAIGVSLFDSVFIALPAFIGYMGQADFGELGSLLLICGVSHGIGVILGSRTAHRIRQKPLKIFVAIFSIAIAGYMIVNFLNVR